MYKISVIGTGYVGLSTGVCLSDMGNQVTCVDIDEEKINTLKNGKSPIYEPGMEDLIHKNTKADRLQFTTNLESAVQNTDIIFIAVGTPSRDDGSADLSFIYEASKTIAKAMNDYKIIVTKSTVPVGTNKEIEDSISQNTDQDFSVVSSPEFLREGSAIYDTMNPDRIVIGYRDEQAGQTIKDLYKDFDTEFVMTTTESSEMIKYASNAFLATKISFINEMANICERVGANVEEVAKGMGLDHRISDKFLNAGIGYGGSCFPKDTKALINKAEEVDYNLKIVKAAEEVNEKQKLIVVDKLKEVLGDLEGKTIGILGLAFKPNTDDIRESPALKIIPKLLEAGANVKAYDPKAMENARKVLPGDVVYCSVSEEVAKGVDAVALLTEWNEFIEIEWKDISIKMNQAIIIDGRNFLDVTYLQEQGFRYICI
ncbi:UDP-glucose dehydrogenase family protein [Natranaerobius thermophilus]|uniref:UDP-glucose 6-dehydrogenase n=1 Tax=Natranaerobius thermophilus (strain ATCC BAA-1301 / DSM 18059 / JW/NM-WN-LF) TaxID=457570 RepID=B2A1P9_NATTJ|nr:UDP-glucose/GDP-mannose dehydrogenase family protein [Natranaerobius thermophilus]ACB86096.1 nucleotide sugar dehydrogenase [Natranaerobius thermophilus JW/NM-WN-LF]